MAEWTQEEKDKIVKKYTDREPTPENSIEILKELAEEHGKTANGVRIILQRANVYVKKADATKTAAAGSETKAPRLSKADAQAKLTTVIESQGLEVEADHITKMTGKTALYLAEVIGQIIDKNTDD